MTHEGGVEPIESLDARHIFYLDRHPLDGANNVASAARLKMMSVDGGEENTLLNAVHLRLWGVTERGIAFVTIGSDFDAVDLYRLPERKIVRMGCLPFQIARRGYGRAIFAQDGHRMLANTTDRWEGNLMMIENFR
jgi:hypothetical protein